MEDFDAVAWAAVASADAASSDAASGPSGADATSVEDEDEAAQAQAWADAASPSRGGESGEGARGDDDDVGGDASSPIGVAGALALVASGGDHIVPSHRESNNARQRRLAKLWKNGLAVLDKLLSDKNVARVDDEGGVAPMMLHHDDGAQIVAAEAHCT